MNRLLIIFCLTIYPAICVCQETNLSDIIINIAEELAADDSDPEAVSSFIDRLNELSENPVRLNSSNEDEISRLFFLSDFQVKALADYAHSSGRIVSIFELAAIPGFEKETVEMMIPFVTLVFRPEEITDSVRWRNTLISNFSIKSGRYDSSNLGSNWRILTKYRFTSGGFSGGLTIEKDPGEKFLTGHPPLPDFFSAHLAYTGSGIIRRIIIGDYSARFGQGTNINTGMRRGISLTSPGYMSARDEIKAYTSTEENKFLRGMAAEFSLKNLELVLFFSKNKSDATLTSSDSFNLCIDNFYTSGVHSTPSLLNKKDAVSQMLYGMRFSYNLRNLKLGIVVSQNKLSLPMIPTINDPEKIFDFSGDKNNLYTIYYNSSYGKILLYGEISSNGNKRFAIVQGMSFRLSDRLIFNLLYRNYGTGYTTFFGSGPGSGSKTTNEKGLLGNFIFEAARHLFVSGGCDIQNYPWLKYRCSAPTWGVKKEIKIEFLPSEKITIDGSYNYRLSMVDSTGLQGIPGQEKIVTRGFKIAVRYSVNDNLTLGTRLDYKTADPSESRGFMIFQDLSYSFKTLPVSLWIRYCVFNTEDWSSRIYTYENDLLYSYSIPALAGKGSRSYIMAKWKICNCAEFRIKYGITSILPKGESMENTEEIKMQFRIWF